jgi:hypothetical protein
VKVLPEFGIESLDRLQHSEDRDLFEVVERLAAIREPACQRSRQRHVLLDELVAQRAVSTSAVRTEALKRFFLLDAFHGAHSHACARIRLTRVAVS